MIEIPQAVAKSFDLFTVTTVLFSIAVGVAALFSAIKSTRMRMGEIEASEIELWRRSTLGLPSNPQSEPPPFEKTALASYYNQALAAARISFWFSLTFASIGFAVIVFAFIMHNPSDLSGTILKVISGAIIDAVAGLFFVQSTAAQRSMGEFFDKLRLDRLHVEAREMIDQIESGERRDQLRAQLVLKYAGIEQLLEGAKP